MFTLLKEPHFAARKLGFVCLLSSLALVATSDMGFADRFNTRAGGGSQTDASAGGSSGAAAGQDNSTDASTNDDTESADAEGRSRGWAGATSRSHRKSTKACAQTGARANVSSSNGVHSASADAYGKAKADNGRWRDRAGAYAHADATAGATNPSANAYTKNGNGVTAATATSGQAPNAYGDHEIEVQKGARRSKALAYNDDGSFSYAKVTPRKAFSAAGVYDGDSFNAHSIEKAAKAAAGAYASAYASKRSAKAFAAAKAKGLATKYGTYSKAKSSSYAYASLTVRPDIRIRGNTVVIQADGLQQECRWWRESNVLVCERFSKVFSK